MKHKLWISTSIAALLLGGVTSPIAYADSQNESSPFTVQEGTTNYEQQTATASSSTTEENQNDTDLEESTTTSQVEEIAPAEEAIEESATAQGTWGTAPYEFDESTGTLTVSNGTISSSIVGVDKKTVKNIIFESGVVAPTALIGIFTQFNNLVSVSGDLDTSAVTDMSYAFYPPIGDHLTKLTSVDVSNWDTSNVTNMESMFSYSAVTSPDISGWDTSNVTNMENMFSFSAVTSLDVSGWDTSKVTNMLDMFCWADDLTSLDLSGWDTSKVTNISGMFNSADGLTTLNVSNWDTSNVTSMDGLFVGVSGVTTLDVSGWNTSKVTSMGAVFSGVSGVTTLDLSGWDTSKVTYISGMFDEASGLTTLNVSGWDTSNVTSMYNVFSGVSGVTTLDLSGWDTSKVTDMTYMFDRASGLISLDLSGWDTSNVTSMFYMFNGASGLTSLDLSGWDTSSIEGRGVESIFNETTNLSSLTLGSKTTFSIADTKLPGIKTSPVGYSGKWIKTDGSNSYNSSTNFMEQYDGSSPGTYAWQGTSYSLDVKDLEIYEGEAWTAYDGFIGGSYYLDPASEKVEAKVGFINPLISVFENEKVDTNTPGVYHVTYKLGNVEKQTTVTVLKNEQSLNGSDFTMTVGGSAPTVSDFKATATDRDGKELDVSVDLSKADVTKARIYDVVLSTSDGQSKTVKLTVKDKVVTGNEITTPNTGDKVTSGTSTSVINSSNNTIKTPSNSSYSSNSLPKTGDESSAASIVFGFGLALISLLTLGFVRKRNK